LLRKQDYLMLKVQEIMEKPEGFSFVDSLFQLSSLAA
jgi:hypothetical protein